MNEFEKLKNDYWVCLTAGDNPTYAMNIDGGALIRMAGSESGIVYVQGLEIVRDGNNKMPSTRKKRGAK